MGLTTFIIVGNSPSFTPGIPNPGYLLLLHENDRPAWELIPLYPELQMDLGRPSIVWIPSIESMLEDALLMIGIYVVKDEEIIENAKMAFRGSLDRRIEIHFTDRKKLKNLRSIARRKLQNYDIALVIIPEEDSTILKQLDILRKYGNLWYQVSLPDKKLSNTPEFFKAEQIAKYTENAQPHLFPR